MGLLGHFFADGFLGGGEEGEGDDCSDDGSEDGRDPEEPELPEGCSVDEDCGAGAAGGIYGGVGDGDADEMDEGEAEADGDGREAFGGALVGGAEDDEEEEGGEHDFDEEAGEEGIAAGGMGRSRWWRSRRGRSRACRWR